MKIFPIRYFFAGFLFGVFIAASKFLWSGVLPFAFFIRLFFKKPAGRYAKIILFIVGFVFGAARFSYYKLPCFLPPAIPVKFFAVISEFPDVRVDHTRYTVKILSDETKALVFAPLYPVYEYGDLVRISGKAELTPKSTDICGILWSSRIDFIHGEQGNFFLHWLFKFRNFTGNILGKIFPEPEASLAKGLLLGDRGGFSKEITDAFRKSGLTHLVALSGFNVTIVIIFFSFLLQNLIWMKRFKFFLTGFGITAFVVLTGASASVTRAALMGFLWLTGREIGRPGVSFHALLIASFAMVFWNPRVLLYDVGFQLSALATFGLVFASKYFSRYTAKLPSCYGLRDAFIFTIVAQIFTAPVVLKNFGVISFVAPISNILVTPLIPFAMGLLFIAFVLGAFWLPLGIYFGFLPSLFLAWIIKVAETLSVFSNFIH